MLRENFICLMRTKKEAKRVDETNIIKKLRNFSMSKSILMIRESRKKMKKCTRTSDYEREKKCD